MEQLKRDQQVREDRILHQLALSHAQTQSQLRAIESLLAPFPWATVLIGITAAVPAFGSLVLSLLNQQQNEKLTKVFSALQTKLLEVTQAESSTGTASTPIAESPVVSADPLVSSASEEERDQANGDE